MVRQQRIEGLRDQQLVEALQKTTRALLTVTDAQELFRSIIQETMNVIGGAGGILYTHDEVRNENIVAASVGIAESVKGMTTPLEGSLSGWVTLNGKSVLSDRNDTRIDQEIAGRIGLTNVAAAPLFFENATVGALVITDKKDASPFTEHDLGLLEIFAAIASAAFSKTHMREAARRYAHELDTIANVLLQGLSTVDAAPDINDFLCNVALEIGQKLDCRVDIGLAARERLVVKVATRYGATRRSEVLSNVELSLSEGVMGRVASHQKPLIVTDVKSTPFYREFSPETRSELAVPLATPEGKLVGVLNLESKKLAAFPLEALRPFTMIGASLTLAIQNIQRLKDLHTLNSISEALGRNSDLDQVLDQTVNTVATLFDAQAGALYLREPGQDFLALSRHRGLPLAVQSRVLKLAGGQSIAGRVLVTGESITVRDMVTDDRIGGTVTAADGLHSLIDVPIKTDQGVIGVLAILTADIRVFTEHEVSLLEAIGNTIGTAIERAQLLRRIVLAEKRYRLLYETAGNPIFITDLEGKILEANHEAASLTGYPRDELKGNVIFDLIVGDEAIRASQERFTKVREGKKVEVREFEIRGKGETSLFVESQIIPLREGDRPVSTVQIIWRDISSRKKHEEKMQKHLNQLRTLFEITREIAFRKLDRAELLFHVATKVRTLLGSDICSVHLFTNEQKELETFIFPDTLFASHGKAPMVQRGEGHIGWGAAMDGAIFKNAIDLTREPIYSPYARGRAISHLLLMPLRTKEKRLGAVSVVRLDGKAQRAYGQEDANYLDGIASIVILALESIRLAEAQ